MSNTAVAKVTSISPEITNKRYTEILQETYELYEQMRRKAVSFYWKLGAKVVEITGTSRDESYGKQLAPKFSDDLFRLHGITLKVDALYKAGYVRRSLTPEQLKLALDGQLSLHQILPLCTRKVTPTMRTEILTDSKKAREDHKPFDIQTALAAKLPPKSPKVEKNEVAENPMKAIRQIGELFRKTEDHLSKYGDSVQAICKGDDPAKMKEAKDFYAEATDAYNNLADTWKEQMAKSDSALQSVSEVVGK